MVNYLLLGNLDIAAKFFGLCLLLYSAVGLQLVNRRVTIGHAAITLMVVVIADQPSPRFIKHRNIDYN